jgi:hypothetical protein
MGSVNEQGCRGYQSSHAMRVLEGGSWTPYPTKLSLSIGIGVGVAVVRTCTTPWMSCVLSVTLIL